MSMRKDEKAQPAVAWELVQDPQYLEKLRKVFELLMDGNGDADGACPSEFDESISAAHD